MVPAKPCIPRCTGIWGDLSSLTYQSILIVTYRIFYYEHNRFTIITIIFCPRVCLSATIPALCTPWGSRRLYLSLLYTTNLLFISSNPVIATDCFYRAKIRRTNGRPSIAELPCWNLTKTFRNHRFRYFIKFHRRFLVRGSCFRRRVSHIKTDPAAGWKARNKGK